jgi:transposase-like protein
MKKKWSAKEKSQIVLEGIKGRPVVDICATCGVSQSLYYAWLDKFLLMLLMFLKQIKRTVKNKEFCVRI